MNDCAFCSIVTGAAPATMVYSDDAVCAFLDIRPITPAHTLIVPRVHATDSTISIPNSAHRSFAPATVSPAPCA